MRHRRIGRYMLVMGMMMVAMLLNGCQRRVPDVTGRAQHVAETRLARAGLSVTTVTSAYSDTVVPGAVISQSVAARSRVAPGTEISLTVSVGPEPDADDIAAPSMQAVAAGTFAMGDHWDIGADNEQPVHDVTLSPYEIATYECTNSEYAAVLNWALDQGYISGDSDFAVVYNGVSVLNLGEGYLIEYADGAYTVPTRDGHSMEGHPVVGVSWYGAVAYCNWLSEARGLEPCYDLSDWTLVDADAGGYRLPTEAEWECAAAWDNGTFWRYGNSSDTLSQGAVNYFSANPLELTAEPYTSPVGYYSGQTSPAGCYDMSGNAYEWVHDWYAEDYYTTCSDGVIDPLGPASGTLRMMRGGSWRIFSSGCRTTLRQDRSALHAYNYVGFRVAR